MNYQTKELSRSVGNGYKYLVNNHKDDGSTYSFKANCLLAVIGYIRDLAPDHGRTATETESLGVKVIDIWSGIPDCTGNHVYMANNGGK